MRFSVIVPTKTGLEWINSPLYRDIVKQTFHDFEVMNSNADGVDKARNELIRQAKGDYCVFLDADCRVEPDYLQKLNQILNGYPILRGYVKFTANRKRLAKYHAQMSQRGYDLRQNLTFIPNLTIKRNLFNEVGYFKATDAEWGVRAKAKGYTVTFTPEPLVLHVTGFSLRNRLKEWFRYGIGMGVRKRDMLRFHGLRGLWKITVGGFGSSIREGDSMGYRLFVYFYYAVNELGQIYGFALRGKAGHGKT